MTDSSPRSDDTQPTASALGGVRILDLATVVAGPGAARYFADFGADVIKVERPGGDSTRTMGWKRPEDADSLFWKLINRNKRTVTLDLKTQDGLTQVLRLVETADILFENMRPGRLERLGLGPDVLLARNPKLVIVRITGFGQTGPYAQRPGFATIAEALSGYSAMSGEPDGGPLLPPIALTDEVTALAGAFVAMAALHHSRATGEGQVVDLSLLESMLQIMGPLPAAWAHMGYLQPRLGSGIPFTVPRGTYQCSDGVWVALSASAESVASRVLKVIGLDEDPRFESFQARFEHRVALEAATRSWIRERPSASVIDQFEDVDAAIAPVYTMEDIAKDEHFRARNALINVDGVTMQNVLAQLSVTPGQVRTAGPVSEPQGEEISWLQDRW